MAPRLSPLQTFRRRRGQAELKALKAGANPGRTRRSATPAERRFAMKENQANAQNKLDIANQRAAMRANNTAKSPQMAAQVARQSNATFNPSLAQTLKAELNKPMGMAKGGSVKKKSTAKRKAK